MNYYMQLQKDRHNGLLTDEQYAKALHLMQWNVDDKKQSSTPTISVKKSRRRKSPPMATDENRRRHALRSITKWIFDVELDREETPLYTKGFPGSVKEKEFLPLATKCINYSNNNTVVAAEKNRSLLIESIREMVVTRRRNLRRSKKKAREAAKRPPVPGKQKVVPLSLIYKKRTHFMVLLDGKLQCIPKPEPLARGSTDVTALSPSQNDTTEDEYPLSRSSSCSSDASIMSPSPDTKGKIVQSLKTHFDLVKKNEDLKNSMKVLEDKLNAVIRHNEVLRGEISAARHRPPVAKTLFTDNSLPKKSQSPPLKTPLPPSPPSLPLNTPSPPSLPLNTPSPPSLPLNTPSPPSPLNTQSLLTCAGCDRLCPTETAKGNSADRAFCPKCWAKRKQREKTVLPNWLYKTTVTTGGARCITCVDCGTDCLASIATPKGE